MQSNSDPDFDTSTNLSLIKGDVSYRLQKRMHLIPEQGMGAGRRALLFAAITWLPLALAALWNETHGVSPEEPLLSHFGVHVRCLVAIPLFILAEEVANRVLPIVLAHFEISGLVKSADRQSFHQLLRDIAALRDRLLPWVFIGGLVLAWSTTAILKGQYSDVDWAPNHVPPAPGFGAWWFALVVRPLFLAMLLAWLWRTVLVYVLMHRLARFPLSIVPIHPDRHGGLGFVERVAMIFSPVALAISAVAASSFAHDVVYHGVHVLEIKFELAGIAILVSLLFLAPFIPLTAMLLKVKRRAILDYGALLARHGRLVHRRWILSEKVEEVPILDAPELGPVADIQTMYQAVQRLSGSSLEKLGLLMIALPAALPVLIVAMIEIPVVDIFKQVLKAVM